MTPETRLALYGAAMGLAGLLLIVLAVWLERPQETP
jgi:hypothetical protein